MKLPLPLTLCFALALLLSFNGCRGPRPDSKLVADPASSALIPPHTLSIAFPIRNQSGPGVQDLQITAIALEGATATLSTPSLPLALGDLSSGAQVIVPATLSGEVAAGGTYDIRVAGTFRQRQHTFKFSLSRTVHVPPPSPGSATSSASSSAPNHVTGGKYPGEAPNFPIRGQ